ncbi:MAG: glycosyltransferase [Phycisphaerae bacterium]|nr:glycosyltransferase [Phycisphaerae bacterium]
MPSKRSYAGGQRPAERPRLLMFTTGFAPYAASENLVNGKLALALLACGYDIDVISRQDPGFQYSNTWSEPWLSLRERTYEAQYEAGSGILRGLDSVRQVCRVGHPAGGVRWAGRAAVLGMRLHRQRPYDFILSRAPCDVAHLPAMYMARKTQLPWVANWNDPPAHIWPPPYHEDMGGLTRRIYRRLATAVFRHASAVTFPSERLRQYVLSRMGHPKDRLTAAIPHVGLCRTSFPKIGKQRGGRFTLCHAGNLSPERHPEIFLRTLARFVEDRRASGHVSLELLGVDAVGIGPLVSRCGLTSVVTAAAPRPYRQTLQHLATRDALLILEAPCREGIFLPSKLVDYAQVGRPILGVSPKNGVVADALARGGGGIAVDCRDPKEIYHGLKRLYESWKDGSLDERYGSRRLYDAFTPRIVADAYERLLDQLVKPVDVARSAGVSGAPASGGTVCYS